MKSITLLPNTISKSFLPTITMLIGLPGSGKSTWARTYLSDLTILSTDDLLEEWATTNGKTYNEAFNEPGLYPLIEKQMYKNLVEAFTAGKHIVIDRTNLSRKIRSKILGRLPPRYIKFAAVFQVERDELDKRLQQRYETTGKHIPSHVIYDMLNRFEHPLTYEFHYIFV